MAVRSRGQKKEFVDEIKTGGVATQVELNQAIADHIADKHSDVGASIGLPPATEGNQIVKSNDDNEWVVVAADDPVEGLTVISLPYYYDELRGKYLDNQLVRVVFYENGTDRRRRYMNYIPEIRSDRVPFKIYDNEKYCIVNAEYYTTDQESGEVIEVRDMAAGAAALATVNLGDTATDNFFIDTVDITLNEGVELAARIMDTRLDNPTLILGLRKVWDVT
jgi:hypothetical protein